jgi:hypothetical protein
MSFQRTNWDWDQALVHPAVNYPSNRVSSPGGDKVIATVQNFNPTFNTPHRRNHSLNESNQGLFSLPQEYDFEITVRPFGTGYEILTRCQHGDRYFDVSLQPIADYQEDPPNENTGVPTGNWGPNILIMEGCKVNTRDERYSYTDQPTVTFSCVATKVASDLNSDGSIASDGTERFGDGDGNQLTDSELGLSDLT